MIKSYGYHWWRCAYPKPIRSLHQCPFYLFFLLFLLLSTSPIPLLTEVCVYIYIVCVCVYANLLWIVQTSFIQVVFTSLLNPFSIPLRTKVHGEWWNDPPIALLSKNREKEQNTEKMDGIRGMISPISLGWYSGFIYMYSSLETIQITSLHRAIVWAWLFNSRLRWLSLCRLNNLMRLQLIITIRNETQIVKGGFAIFDWCKLFNQPRSDDSTWLWWHHSIGTLSQSLDFQNLQWCVTMTRWTSLMWLNDNVTLTLQMFQSAHAQRVIHGFETWFTLVLTGLTCLCSWSSPWYLSTFRNY